VDSTIPFSHNCQHTKQLNVTLILVGPSLSCHIFFSDTISTERYTGQMLAQFLENLGDE